MIENVRGLVYRLLKNDNSGHGIEHMDRVLKLALKFAKDEGANLEIVTLASLLHDVDDYKLFGNENAEELNNARKILDESKIDDNIKQEVLTIIGTMGYSKLLKGIRPVSIEGKIVSDADMCDAIGANGILRVYTYSSKNGKPFFDKNIYPIEDMSADKYTRKVADTSVCHIFEKILKLKNLMMTKSGKQEAIKRHDLVIKFLQNLFEEENAEDWISYLNTYNKNN